MNAFLLKKLLNLMILKMKINKKIILMLECKIKSMFYLNMKR